MTALALVIYLVAGAIVAATALPIWQTSLWWVRLCDFPRYQIVILALAVLISMPLALGPLTEAELVLFLAVLLAALWQISWIWRYLPGAPLEVLAKPGRVRRVASVF
jgi:hypothetical protein